MASSYRYNFIKFLKNAFFVQTLTIDPQKTLISSGGNIILRARDLNNTAGSISARRNIAISGSKLINRVVAK